MAATVRVLPPEEWDRLAAYEPFKSNGLPTIDHWRVIIVEDDGKIVGFCCLFNAVHWEPWWIAPLYRGKPGILRQLIEQSEAILTEAHVQTAFVTVGDDLPENQDLVEHFGFERAPGALYFRHLDLEA